MKKLLYLTLMAAVMLIMSAFTACSSDEPETPEVNSREAEMEAVLENKIWEEQRSQTRWMTEEGKLVTEDMLEPMSGDKHYCSYFFSGDKVSVFDFYVYIPVGQRSWRYDYTYSIDWATGEVSFFHLNGKADYSITIESVTADELVVRDSYNERPDAKYRRRVLTPVAKADEQKWWDEYEDHSF